MPQSMQEKRKSSLARLKATKESYELELRHYHRVEFAGTKVANLTRMIEQTEAAIQKGGR